MEKILDGFDAAIALMKTVQSDDFTGCFGDDLVEDATCIESFLNRMLDKMLVAEMAKAEPLRWSA